MNLRMLALLGLLAAGCGRFGFEPSTSSGDASPDAPLMPDPDATPADFIASLACETDIAVDTGLDATDQMAWLDLGAEQVLFVMLHHSDTNHEVRAIRLGIVNDAVAVTDNTSTYQAEDLHGFDVVDTPSGVVALVTDVPSHTLRRVQLDARFQAISDTPINELGEATTPFVRSGSSRLLLGRTSTTDFNVVPVDASVTVTGQPTLIASPGDLPNGAPTPTGFVVGYQNGPGIDCRFVQLDANGSPTGTTIIIPTPNQCEFPRITRMGNGAFAYAVVYFDGLGGLVAYTGTIDAAFTTATVPAGTPSSAQELVHGLVADGDRAIATLVTGSDAKLLEIRTSGTSDLGGVLADGRTSSIVAVGGGLIHVREGSGTLSIRKLCR